MMLTKEAVHGQRACTPPGGGTAGGPCYKRWVVVGRPVLPLGWGEFTKAPFCPNTRQEREEQQKAWEEEKERRKKEYEERQEARRVSSGRGMRVFLNPGTDSHGQTHVRNGKHISSRPSTGRSRSRRRG
jgi:hypothetical protein